MPEITFVLLSGLKLACKNQFGFLSNFLNQ